MSTIQRQPENNSVTYLKESTPVLKVTPEGKWEIFKTEKEIRDLMQISELPDKWVLGIALNHIELTSEVDRLRAALEKIQSHPIKRNSAIQAFEMSEIARRALTPTSNEDE